MDAGAFRSILTQKKKKNPYGDFTEAASHLFLKNRHLVELVSSATTPCVVSEGWNRVLENILEQDRRENELVNTIQGIGVGEREVLSRERKKETGD